MLFIMSLWRHTIRTAMNPIYVLPRGVILHRYNVVYIRQVASPQGNSVQINLADLLYDFLFLALGSIWEQGDKRDISMQEEESNRRTGTRDQDLHNLHFSRTIINVKTSRYPWA